MYEFEVNKKYSVITDDRGNNHRLHTDTILVTFKKDSKQYFNPSRKGRKKCYKSFAKQMC